MKIKKIFIKINPLTWAIIPIKETIKESKREQSIRFYFLCIVLIIQKVRK